MTIFDWLKERGIEIKNRKLMEQAFTHSSYLNEHKKAKHDNERLEFMGDAVLQIWSSVHLFKITPPLSEGQMTRLRASIVCEKSLSEFAKTLHLNEFLKLGVGEEKSGGREKDSLVSDMFEAFIGALYLDQGYEAVNRVMEEVVSFVDIWALEEIDYKTRLQEYVQSDSRNNVVYELISQSGPSNKPLFEVNCVFEGIVLGTGSGTSKKRAEQAAAQNAFEKMVK